MKLPTLSIAALASLGSAVFSGHAWGAEDVKVYPGAACVAVGDPQPFPGTNGGAAAGTQSRDWVCPAVRDNETVKNWAVTVRRGPDTRAWSIALRYGNPAGTTFSQSVVTVPAAAGVHTLNGGSISSSVQGGAYFLLTRVPPLAEIITYQVREN